MLPSGSRWCCVWKVHPMWNVNAILATHYGKPLITLHRYTVSLLKSRREKDCLLSPRVSKPLLKAPSLLLFLFLAVSVGKCIEVNASGCKVKILEKRLWEKKCTSLMHAFYQKPVSCLYVWVWPLAFLAVGKAWLPRHMCFCKLVKAYIQMGKHESYTD